MKSFQLGISLTLTGWTSPPVINRRLASPEAETRSHWPPPPSRGRACGACSLLSFRCPRLFDLELVLWAPLEEDRAALGVERLGRRRLEVLPDDLQLPAAVELDHEAGHHAGVDDVANAP